MMDLLEKDEFLKTYRSVSGQLKRKFVRKPNLSEVVEAYEALARQQADVGFVELSAACRLAAAQLEQAAAPIINGNHLYLESAQSYSAVPDKVNSFSCYDAAASCSNDSTIAWMTCMEAGHTALQLQDYLNASNFFSRAFKSAESDMEKSLAGENLASSYIQQGLYSDALKVLSLLNNKGSSQQRIRMTKLLLALNLRRHGTDGESKLSQCILNTTEESKNSFRPSQLQQAIDYLLLMMRENDHDDQIMDESLVATLWQCLSGDQKQLLVALFV